MGDYIKAQSRDVHEFELKNEKELRHFARLVEFAEKKWNQGVFKIIAPRQWAANQLNFRDVNHDFTMQYETWQPCVDQEETACFVRVIEDDNQGASEDLRALATREARQTHPEESGRITVSRFFPRRQRQLEKRVASGTVTGSRFSEYADAFNLRNLRTILNLGTLHNGHLHEEPGITVPQTVWHIIHTKRGNIARFEGALRHAFRHDFVERGVNHCQNPLQHPQWIVSPSFLRRHKIKFSTVVQQAGDILVILPKAYFMAFNCEHDRKRAIRYDTLDRHSYIEYQKRRRLECANRRGKEEIGRLRTELEEERRGCPLRHPHGLRQVLGPCNEAKLAGRPCKKMTPGR